MEKNINVKIMGVFASILLLFIVITASFAYFGSFDVNLNNNVAVNINAVSPGDATFISNATQLNLQVPAANMSQTASNNEVAAASNTATLTVNLTGAANLLTTCTYDIVYEYDSTSNVYGKSPTTKNGDKEITLQVSNVNGTNNFANEKNFDYDSNWSGLKRTLVSGATIESDGTLTTQNISITGKYYNLTIPQTSIEGKAFTGKIYVTNHSCETIEPAYITLLKAYGGKDNITELPDSAFASVTTASDKGMYAKEDDYTATTGMKSYYFRGAVNNNWVKFGKEQIAICTYNNEQVSVGMYDSENFIGVSSVKTQNECSGSGICLSSLFGPVIGVSESNCSDDDDTWVNSSPIYGGLKEVPIFWRIIRINGDGSIRMIYSGTTDPSANSSVVDSNGVIMINGVTQLAMVDFNDSSFKAEYVGYMYTEGEQHGNSTPSRIKTAIDNWYAGTTLKDNALVSQDQIFCNDRSASSDQTAAWTSTGAIYYYGAYGRLNSNKKPILTCPEESDKFTSKDSSIGNKALTYPVGLITEDEVAMAGGVVGTSNSSYYLYTNQAYWSGSPGHLLYTGRDSMVGGFLVLPSGGLGDYVVTDFGDVRPVVSLSSKAKLLGSGTYSKPYTVS